MNHDLSFALKEIFLSVLNESDVRNEICRILSDEPKDINVRETECSKTADNQSLDSVLEKISSAEKTLSDILSQIRNDNNDAAQQFKDNNNSALQQFKDNNNNALQQFKDNNNDTLQQIKDNNNDTLRQIRYEISNNNKEAENSLSVSLGALIEEKFKYSVKDQIDEYKRKNTELNEENQRLKEENIILENKYRPVFEITDIYEKINTLENDTKSYIEQLCGSLDIYSVISLGRDTNKISQLWSYLKECAVSSGTDKDKTEILNQYFEFCINTANSIKEQFEFYEIEPGSEFNRDTCIKTANSNQIGTITRIITKCVKNKNKVFYPAVVEIK